MTLATFPAFAHVRELRLAIRLPDDEVRRPLNLKAPYAPSLREMWEGDVLFAPQSRDDAHAFSAWFEALDGRTTAFKFQFTAGKWSQPAVFSAVLASVPVLGSDTLSLTLTGNPTDTLKAGTLISIGNIETTTFQLFEVVEDFTQVLLTYFTDSTAFTDALGFTDGVNVNGIRVAPRVGRVFSLGDAVALGTVYGKFYLAKDEVAGDISLFKGEVAAQLLEAA